MLDEGKRVVTETSGTSGGFIDMGYIFTLGSHFIPNLIKGYLEEKGKNHIHFSFGQEQQRKSSEELKDGKYDLAFFLLMWKGKMNLNLFGWSGRTGLITPKDHPLAQKEEIDLLDTIEYDYVYLQEQWIKTSDRQLFFKIKKGNQRLHMKGKKILLLQGLLQQDLELRLFQDSAFLIQWMCVSSDHITEIERYIYLVLKKKISDTGCERFYFIYHRSK